MEIYPLTIVKDRYNGIYSGGLYTAWNLYPWQVPNQVFRGDIACSDFWGLWRKGKIADKCGRGETPGEAEADLKKQYCLEET